MKSSAPLAELDAALPRLRRYARVLTGAVNEADALVLHTLAEAHVAARQQQPRESLHVMLFRLMHQRHAAQRSAAATEPAPTASASQPVAATGSSELLLSSFGRLPVEEREVLLLAAVERMDYADIAAVLGVPPATVIARLRRARERMHGAGASAR